MKKNPGPSAPNTRLTQSSSSSSSSSSVLKAPKEAPVAKAFSVSPSAVLYIPSPEARYARVGFLKGPTILSGGRRRPTLIPALVFYTHPVNMGHQSGTHLYPMDMWVDEPVDFNTRCDVKKLNADLDIATRIEVLELDRVLFSPALDGVVPPKLVEDTFVHIDSTKGPIKQWISLHPYWWHLVDLTEPFAERMRAAAQKGNLEADQDLKLTLKHFLKSIYVKFDYMAAMMTRGSCKMFDWGEMGLLDFTSKEKKGSEEETVL